MAQIIQCSEQTTLETGGRIWQMFVTVKERDTREHGWTVIFALQTSKVPVCNILCIRNNIRSYLLKCCSTYLRTMRHILTLQFTVVVTGDDPFIKKNTEDYVSHIPFKQQANTLMSDYTDHNGMSTWLVKFYPVCDLFHSHIASTFSFRIFNGATWYPKIPFSPNMGNCNDKWLKCSRERWLFVVCLFRRSHFHQKGKTHEHIFSCNVQSTL